MRSRNCLPFTSTWVYPRVFGVVRVAHLFSLLCCPIMCLYVLSYVLWCPLRCSVRLYLQLFVGGLMSYLRYLCLFAYSGVQHILYFVFFCLVYPMLTVSLPSNWQNPIRGNIHISSWSSNETTTGKVFEHF